MEDSSSRLNFSFALNHTVFSDRILHIQIMSDSLCSNFDSHGCADAEKFVMDYEESPVVGEVKTLRISSPILAAHSPFFYKLFTNGMKESQQQDVTLRINKSEDAALEELLNFMYSNTLSATTVSDLLGVLTIANKFEVTSCVKYCSALLQKMPMSLDSSLLYVGLPPSVVVSEFVQSLINEAKQWLADYFNDIKRSEKEAMTLPLVGVEAVFGSGNMQVYSDSSDVVFEFILKWARAHYPKLEQRREIITKHLTQLIPFPQMSCSKLKEVLICADFEYEQVSKIVLEALFSKSELCFGQHIYDLNKCKLSVMEAYPRYTVYFIVPKEELDILSSSEKLRSVSFFLNRRWFHLEVTREKKGRFGMYLKKTKGSDSCDPIEFEISGMKKSTKEFQIMKKKCNPKNSDLLYGYGVRNLFGMDSGYFIDGILHLRVDITIINNITSSDSSSDSSSNLSW